MKNKTYYTIIGYVKADLVWDIVFGDFDREVVDQELDDLNYNRDFDPNSYSKHRIISTGSSQKEIESKVKELNEKEATKGEKDRLKKLIKANKPAPVKYDVTIRAVEWFDKQNGNSYFSAVGWINGVQLVALPMQYGYGEHYADQVLRALSKLKLIPLDYPETWRGDLLKKGIKIDQSITRGCKKRDVENFTS